MNSTSQTKPASLTHRLNPKFYVGLYCCTIIYSLIFVWILEHYLPNLHAGMGLIKGDNFLFHQLSAEMAKNITQKGWSEWKLFSIGMAGSLNVGVTTVVYYFFGIHPKLIILINALFQTLSAFLLGKIIYKYTQRAIYSYIVSAIFCFFPVTLIWVSQLHKDNYAILAWILIFYGLIIRTDSKKYQSISLTAVGLILLLITRPFYLKLVCAFLALDIFFTLIKDQDQILSPIINFILACSALFAFYKFVPVASTLNDHYDATQHITSVKINPTKTYAFVWSGDKKGLDKIFLQMASMRAYQIFLFNNDSNSFIDRDVILNSAKDVIFYTPRAFEISLLEPNPLFLIKLKSLTSITAIFEMLVYYFFLLCLLIALYLRKIEFTLLKVVAYSLICSTTLAFISPVMGAFHRTRYPFFFMIIVVGIISLHRLIEAYRPTQK